MARRISLLAAMKEHQAMPNQHAKAEAFHRLHVPGSPLVIFNAWDAGSAQAVMAAGARAVGTGSWSVAAAHGYPDGEQMPLSLAIANIERIAGVAGDLPVTMDLESGYGLKPEDVAHSVSLAIGAGAVGINLEDGFPDENGMRDIDVQVERIRAARAAAEALGVQLFINARTDYFLLSGPERHDAAMVRMALDRAAAYAGAGASGLFVPGICRTEYIRAVCAGTKLPVNVMMMPTLPPAAELARLGVARISHGPGPYRAAMSFIEQAARAAITGT
jgi:2-methylisocitrate lyase-like PEP mutase family enzyme